MTGEEKATSLRYTDAIFGATVGCEQNVLLVSAGGKH